MTVAKKYLIGGLIDKETGTLTVYRSDFRTITVPVSLRASCN
jgi:hypothetical protein